MWTRSNFFSAGGAGRTDLRQQKNAARRLLHQVINAAILGLRDANIIVFRKPALWRVFFLAHGNSFSCYRRTGLESEWPTKSLPEYFSHSKRYTTCKCSTEIMQL